MDRVIAAPASRNSPCPCGSGLRYKDCHGSLGGPPRSAPVTAAARSTYRAPDAEWAHLDAGAREECGVLMEASLHHQTAGRLDEAARGYREVLAQAPKTHDTLHMLGVIELERQDLGEAERLMRAALALRPTYPTIEHNLRLVEDARIVQMRAQPEQLAERALPILSELALTGPDRSLRRAASEGSTTGVVHLVGRVRGDDDAWLLQRLCEVLGPLQVCVWTTDRDGPDTIAGVRITAIDAAIGALPRGGIHVYVGLDLDYSEWIARASADRVIAIPVGAPPTLCLDQLRALAHDGARRVELALLSPSMAARFGRGHHAVAPPIAIEGANDSAHEAFVYDEWRIEDPPPWPVGISGQNRHNVAQPTDIVFIKSMVAIAGCLHVHDPGRLRFALGADARVRFFSNGERSLPAFLSSLRCYVHRVDHWWDEGLGREMFCAMALGLPVLCPRDSLYADYVDDGVDGVLYGSTDEALARLKELRRAPAFAASVGEAARAKAARVFDPTAIGSAWRKLVRGDDESPRWPSDAAFAPTPAAQVAP
jgi:hypothetical protein